jgi:predicted ATP-grasp superfamily ATP-dependent carboligase
MSSSSTGALVVGGDYQGLGIARSLGRQGVPVFVLDDERSIARTSRYVQRHARVRELRSREETLDALVNAVDRFGLQGWVLYPTREETVAAVATERKALGELLRVPTPEWASVRQAWDKRETYRVAAELGIPTPKTWLPRDEEELALVDLTRPVVIKPAIKENFFYATGAKGWRADTGDELVARYREAAAVVDPEEIIVQEMIPGGGDRQVAYCAFFKDGRPVASMTARRLRQHPSDFGRASTFVETVDIPELEELSLRFLHEIGYYGLVELEYKQDAEDGTYKLLDVNARTWGYHSLGPAAGVDFPYLLFRDQVGLPVDEVKARVGVRWIRLLTDLPNAVRDMAAKRIRARDYLRSLRGVDTEAVFSWRDPLPGLYEVALLPYLAVRRGL